MIAARRNFMPATRTGNIAAARSGEVSHRHAQAARTTTGFRQVEVDDETGTVVWPGGADLAPDTLYERARTGAWPDQDLATYPRGSEALACRHPHSSVGSIIKRQRSRSRREQPPRPSRRDGSRSGRAATGAGAEKGTSDGSARCPAGRAHRSPAPPEQVSSRHHEPAVSERGERLEIRGEVLGEDLRRARRLVRLCVLE